MQVALQKGRGAAHRGRRPQRFVLDTLKGIAMFEDGWAFDVMKGFGDYAYAEDRRKRPRRTETPKPEYEYDDEDNEFEGQYDEEE